MVEVKLTKYELVLLAGLVGSTNGHSLDNVYFDLIQKLKAIDPSGELKWLADEFTEHVTDILNGRQINEDEIYDEVFHSILKRWGV